MRPDGSARIGPGARQVDVVSSLAARGLAVPMGSCPSVALGGLALGGGFGLAARAFGLTADNVSAVEIVTADGRILQCDRRRHAELFWASRGGGGGSFGVATQFNVRTHAVSTVSTFYATYAWSQLDAVIRAWFKLMADAPDALTSVCSVSTGRSEPTLHVSGQFIGSLSELTRALSVFKRDVAPLRLTSNTHSYLDAQLIWAGCLGRSIPACHPSRVPGGTLGRDTFAGKSDYLREPLTQTAIGVLRTAIERRQLAGQGSGVVLLDSYGGAINRVLAENTAFVHRDMRASLQYLAYWLAPPAKTASTVWLRELHAAMRPHVSGSAYQNYIDPELTTWRQAYYGSAYPRLTAVKTQYDPDRLFRFAQAAGT